MFNKGVAISSSKCYLFNSLLGAKRGAGKLNYVGPVIDRAVRVQTLRRGPGHFVVAPTAFVNNTSLSSFYLETRLYS